LPANVFPVPLEAGVPAQLLDRRPDVCQAEAELMQSFYNVNAARAAFFPQLTLAGTAGWTDRHSGISVDPAQLFVNAAASLLQPVFQRGHLRANYRVAEAEREAALLNYQQTVLRAGAEVNNALYQSQTAQQRITVDSARVEALGKAVDHTTQLMQYGRANYLEVLTAQQSLLSARQALAEDVYTRALAMISLYHAIGGGTD
jgi:outer membrane protein TolC